jgi:hypothetical protein
VRLTKQSLCSDTWPTYTHEVVQLEGSRCSGNCWEFTRPKIVKAAVGRRRRNILYTTAALTDVEAGLPKTIICRSAGQTLTYLSAAYPSSRNPAVCPVSRGSKQSIRVSVNSGGRVFSWRGNLRGTGLIAATVPQPLSLRRSDPGGTCAHLRPARESHV